MKKLSILFGLAIAMFIFNSCKKDDNSSIIGSTTATVDGSSAKFTTTGTTASFNNYQNIIVTGTTASLTSLTTFNLYTITILAPTIEKKKYPIPAYTQGFTYNPLDGYASAEFSKTKNSVVEESYSTLSLKNASGYVTVEDITATSAKGSFDITLVNTSDSLKTLKFVGQFTTSLTVLNN